MFKIVAMAQPKGKTGFKANGKPRAGQIRRGEAVGIRYDVAGTKAAKTNKR